MSFRVELPPTFAQRLAEQRGGEDLVPGQARTGGRSLVGMWVTSGSQVNAEIAARREAATAEVAASRAAAGDVAGAVRDLAGRTLELALGRPADSAAVSAAVDSVTSAGVGS